MNEAITLTVKPITPEDVKALEAVRTFKWGTLSRRYGHDASANVCAWWDEDGEERWLHADAVAKEATRFAVVRSAERLAATL